MTITLHKPAPPKVACPDWCERRQSGCPFEWDVSEWHRRHRATFTVEGPVDNGQVVPWVTAEVYQYEDVKVTPDGRPLEAKLDEVPQIRFELGVTSDTWTAEEARQAATAMHEVLTKAAAVLEGIDTTEVAR